MTEYSVSQKFGLTGRSHCSPLFQLIFKLHDVNWHTHAHESSVHPYVRPYTHSSVCTPIRPSVHQCVRPYINYLFSFCTPNGLTSEVKDSTAGWRCTLMPLGQFSPLWVTRNPLKHTFLLYSFWISYDLIKNKDEISAACVLRGWKFPGMRLKGLKISWYAP